MKIISQVDIISNFLNKLQTNTCFLKTRHYDNIYVSKEGTFMGDLPKWALILIIVVASLIAIWILLLIVNLIFFGFFNSVFKKHKKAMTVILYSKLENMGKLFAILKQSGIKIDDRLSKMLSDINVEDFQEPNMDQFEKSKNTLSYLKDEVMFIANQNPDLNTNPDFVQAKNNVIESDAIYRSNVVMYNADVLGYNYWIRFLPCRFIFKMFKVKKKQIIS